MGNTGLLFRVETNLGSEIWKRNMRVWFLYFKKIKKNTLDCCRRNAKKALFWYKNIDFSKVQILWKIWWKCQYQSGSVTETVNKQIFYHELCNFFKYIGAGNQFYYSIASICTAFLYRLMKKINKSQGPVFRNKKTTIA